METNGSPSDSATLPAMSASSTSNASTPAAFTAVGASRRTICAWFFTRSTVKRNEFRPFSVLSFRSSPASVPSG